MGRYNKKQRLEAELVEQEAKRRGGLIKLIVSIGGFVVLLIVRQYFASAGAEWVSNPIVSFSFFVLAVVAAAVAGLGGRDFARARARINQIYRQL